MNSDSPLKLTWEGPFAFFGSAAPVVFEQPIAESPGIYLWTFRFEDGFLVDYVGQTGKSFGERFQQHVAEQCSGVYSVTDGCLTLKRRENILWPGMYWKKGQRSRTGQFLARLPELAIHIHKLYGNYRLFLAPLEADRRVLERVEAALALHLRSVPGLVSEVQSPGVRYRPRLRKEPPFTVAFESKCNIIGLPSELEA